MNPSKNSTNFPKFDILFDNETFPDIDSKPIQS